MKSQYDKFYGYLDDLVNKYQRLSVMLQQKLQAINEFDLDTMDRLLKEEQVYAMLSRGFEANIQQYKAQLGYRGNKLSVITEELPEEERQRFRDVHKRLQAVLTEVKLLNDTCQDMLQNKLHVIDQNIKEMEQSGKSYGQAAQPAKPADPKPAMFSKSI